MALIKDIRDYSAGDIREKAGLKPNERIDLVVGGPPCQAFSTAGRRLGFNDDRGNVFLTFIDRIRELKPRFAVIEVNESAVAPEFRIIGGSSDPPRPHPTRNDPTRQTAIRLAPRPLAPRISFPSTLKSFCRFRQPLQRYEGGKIADPCV